MKKKILTKQIALALAMAGLFPMGQAWAKTVTEESGVLNITLGYQEQESLTQDWEKYETVKIEKDTGFKIGLATDPALWGSQSVDLSKTNFEITTDSFLETNVDAFRVRASNKNIKLGNFTATVHAFNSDALSIGDEGDNNTVEVNNFKAEVDSGSGIRVNASKWGGADGTKAELIIHGTTDITINGNALSSNYAPQKGAAIYAGYDEGGTNNDDLGIVTLEKDAKITLNAGSGAYGLWAGRNGTIKTQQDLTIIATKANSDGIAATNTDYNTATSWGENKLGSNIELNGDAIQIDMEGANSRAIYASGENTNVKSGENGIGWFNFTGDVMAEDGGLIDLHATGNQSWMEGDVKAYGTENGKNATVTLSVENALAGQGTIAAANGGIVSLTLGDYSNWTGRADDYQDADNPNWSHTNIANEFIDEGVSDEDISKSGTVNLTLGQNAMWNVTGQSWVTSLKGDGSLIFLDGDNTGGYSLHVGTLSGENTFVMNVRPNESGDMLYVKNGTSDTQHLVINNRDEVLGNMDVGDKVRFATVQNAGGGFIEGDIGDASSLPSDAGTFGAKTRISGAGVFNVDFGIEYHKYGEDVKGDKAGEDAETANDVYNGDSFSEDKPGSDYVEGNYGKSGNVDGQSLYAAEDDLSDGEDLQDGAQNVYLVRQPNSLENVSNAGQTILSMSKVNYSNAVYMDRLNKRMGEARYIEGDDGLWVRLRHDRIGKDDAFRSMNTMFELGYDWHAKGQKDGEHRQGVAFDYMRGTADYKNVAGDGDVRRAGVWLYDTWMGDKGHYSDYVVKYGRLSNDFDIYSELGEKISGDYDNDVWSVSAEYGRKKDIGNDWYIEPQAQMQYAYVTSADYTTSQGTKVELDGIDSLIGRAGFRLGRDTSEGNTVYFKADILHEFLGDQSIRAMDATGTLSTTYENEGTWYDVGFGFAHKMGKDSYVFLDVEHSFGNDNDDTYQINIGLNRAF